MTAGSPQARPAKQPLDPAFLKLAVILLVGVVMVVFDSTIVNVAIDSLARHLHTTVSDGQWTISGYVLALGMVVPVAAWASARFGAKQVWMVALALFMASSILASVAWNIQTLIAFRVLQGAGGGLMLPIMQNLLVEAAGGRKLGQIMAMISLPTLLGPILGPVVGGLIVTHLSWRWIFWVNVPFSLTGLVLAWRGLKPSSPRHGAHLDLTGLALLSPGLAAILYAVTESGVQEGFGHPVVLVPLAAGIALLVAFTAHALRVSRPLVDLRLFKVRSFSAATSLMFLSGFGTFGALLLLPLYYQQIRGQTAVDAGLLLAPQGFGMMLTRSLAGKLTDTIGARSITLTGILLTAIGTIAFTQVGVRTNEILLGADLVIRGAGLSAVLVPVMATAYLGLRPEQVPHASTVTRIAQQVGGSFGTGILAAVLATRIRSHHLTGLASHAGAFGTAFWWALGFTLVAIIPAIALPHQRERVTDSGDDRSSAAQGHPVDSAGIAQPVGITQPAGHLAEADAGADPRGAG